MRYHHCFAAVMLIGVFMAGVTVSAQILLEPPLVTGTNRVIIDFHTWSSGTGYPHTHYSQFTIMYEARLEVGFSRYTENLCRSDRFRRHLEWRIGALEFPLALTTGGGPFPTENMTADNWSAQLNGIAITDASAPGQTLSCMIMDMWDSTEDGELSTVDTDFTSEIAVLFTQQPSPGDIINNIDITTALRNDLFGSGTGDLTTGFVLRIPNLPEYGDGYRIRFDESQPQIVVNRVTPTPFTCLHDGDINNDGEVTSGDAQLAFVFALGLTTPDPEEACSADCNGDSEITAGDAQGIFYTALGIPICVDID